MTFFEFFIYYVGSSLLYELVVTCFILIRNRYIRYKMKKAIDSGQVRVVTMEELMNNVTKDKKSWN